MSHSNYPMELDASGELDHRWMLVHRYALLNPLHVDRADWQDLSVTALAPPQLQSQTHLLPQLVDLDALPSEERIGLLDRVAHWRQRGIAFFCALLEASADPEFVAGHLKNRMVLRRTGGVRLLFRFYDPAVFRHVPWLLNPVQRNALLGPIQTWSWPDSEGRWQRLTKTVTANEPLPLMPAQWQILERMALINNSLSRLALLEPERVQDATLTQQIDTLLVEAQRDHGMQENEDRLLFVEQAIRFHRYIHRHSEMKARLRRVRATPGSSYSMTCEDLNDDVLQEMAKALDADGRDRGTT